MALYDGSNAPTITVEFDISKEGTFTLGISPLDGLDVLAAGTGSNWSAIPSTDIRSISLRRGRTREDQAVQPGTLSLVLENRSGTYDPDNTSSIYFWDGYSILSAGLGVRVKATWSGTTYVIYRGYLEQLDVDESLDPVAIFQFTDALAWIARQNVSAVSSSYAGDTTATRLGRILDAVNWDASLRSLSGSRTMKATTLGDSALTLADQVARCEFGRFYADRQGNLTLLPYESTFSTPLRVAFSDQRSSGAIEYDTIQTNPGAKYLANSVTLTQATGVTQQYDNATSQARYGTFIKTWDAPLSDNPTAATLAQIIGDRYALPKTRVDRVEFDALGLDSSTWASLLQTDLGDNVTVQRTTVDSRYRIFTSLVESIEFDLDPYNWRVGMNLSPSAGVAFFTLGYSTLDGVDVLYY
jgi:hypothetical protein